MNDNQYICHSSEIICHAGKKGMKWGQGPYSKLKGYVKKAIDEKITGASAQREADAYRKKANSEYNSANFNRDAARDFGDRALGYGNDVETIRKALSSNTTGNFRLSDGRVIKKRGSGKMSEESLLMLSRESNSAAEARNLARSNAHGYARSARRSENKGHEYSAKAASAQRRANKSLFGRARLIFGNPKKKRG